MMIPPDPQKSSLTDAQLRQRTEELLNLAESISQQLQLQTERLAEAIIIFDRDIIAPMREGLHD